MARFTIVIPTIMLIFSLAVTLALARNIPIDTAKATNDHQQSAAMLTDEKNLRLGLSGFGGLGGGAKIGGLPGLIGDIGGYAGAAGGAGLHVGGAGLGGTGGSLGGIGGGLGSGLGGIAP